MTASRRVGKTFLVREYFRDKGVYFELTGVFKATLQQQLQNFSTTLSSTFYQGAMLTPPKDWQNAFTMLHEAITKITSQQRLVLFIDELPWLATPKSSFLNMLEHCWNRYLSDDPRIIMILCGSAAAWMIKKVIKSRGGLHGRLTKQMRLLPFTLHDVEQYFLSQHIKLDRKQIVETYLAFGGIPKYLSLVERGKSAAQNINDICFTVTGVLAAEFNNVYYSLFKNAEQHVSIVKTLAQKPHGLMQQPLLKLAKISSGGGATRTLTELEASGFIAKIPDFGKDTHNVRYKLIDEYSLFYLTWIEKYHRISTDHEVNYWQKMAATQAWKIWAGFAFESLCLKHIAQIKSALGLRAVITRSSAWTAHVKAGQSLGAEIDLVIDRADNCINLCEIKFYNSVYDMTQKDAQGLAHKKTLFQQLTKTKKAIFVTMITAFGVKENEHFHRIVDNQLTLDNFFNH